jgi:simple sugar transport system permease protein
MIATLIVFNMGRSIAYWINGGATPTVESKLFGYLGGFIPGIPIPTPVFIMALVAFAFFLILKRTSLRLYTQAVGINQEAARLNGINIIWTKMLTFIILGACCAIAGAISVARLTLINHETILIGREMDAILAVAIGGNALSGGKFSITGSLLGAYVIQFLMTTLYAMGVPSTDVNAYKAVVIVLIVLAGSPVVKRTVGKLYHTLFKQQRAAAVTEEA